MCDIGIMNNLSIDDRLTTNNLEVSNNITISGQLIVDGTSTFLNDLISFGQTGKDLMNEETIELMTPYCEIELKLWLFVV